MNSRVSTPGFAIRSQSVRHESRVGMRDAFDRLVRELGDRMRVRLMPLPAVRAVLAGERSLAVSADLARRRDLPRSRDFKPRECW